MKFLAIEKPSDIARSKNGDELLKKEAHIAHQYFLKGIIRELYFNEENRLVLMLECDSKNCAQDYLNAFPLVEKGEISFDIMSLSPYTGFSRLFSF